MAKQFTLGKKERLKSRKLIEQLFSEGKKFAVFPFRIFYLFNKPIGPALQFGVGVSSKSFKKAVDRNRIKRVTREAYRLQKISLLEKLKEKNRQLIFFVIYTGKELPEYKEVAAKMSMILNKLSAIIGSTG